MFSDELYLAINLDVKAAWLAGWPRTDVPVYWRSGGPQPHVDPLKQPLFLRNEITFEKQEILAFGSGAFQNFRCQSGMVVVRVFNSRMTGNEDEGLRAIGQATNVFRAYRKTDAIGGDLSFTGAHSGFDWGPSEDGVWFLRGYRLAFEYRFSG